MTESAAENDRHERDDIAYVSVDEQTDRAMTDGGTRPLELQEIYDILADSRRRRCVEYIADHGPADISDITDHIAKLEIGDDASGQPRKRVYIGIYQNHLPGLVESGVLERFDREYSPGPNFEQVLDAIEQVEGVYENHSPEDDADDQEGANTDGGTDRQIPPDEPVDELEPDGGDDDAQ